MELVLLCFGFGFWLEGWYCVFGRRRMFVYFFGFFVVLFFFCLWFFIWDFCCLLYIFLIFFVVYLCDYIMVFLFIFLFLKLYIDFMRYLENMLVCSILEGVINNCFEGINFWINKVFGFLWFVVEFVFFMLVLFNILLSLIMIVWFVVKNYWLICGVDNV